jgi:hypothetical protein
MAEAAIHKSLAGIPGNPSGPTPKQESLSLFPIEKVWYNSILL